MLRTIFGLPVRVFTEAGLFVAVNDEHDLCAQARSLDDLEHEFQRMVVGTATACRHDGHVSRLPVSDEMIANAGWGTLH